MGPSWLLFLTEFNQGSEVQGTGSYTTVKQAKEFILKLNSNQKQIDDLLKYQFDKSGRCCD